MNITKKFVDEVSFEVVGCAIEVHKGLGPGLLESSYHKCMLYELNLRGITFISEHSVPLYYKELKIKGGLRVDLFIESCLVLELKATDTIPQYTMLNY